MAHGVPSFTPRQLLDAGRRAEAEGKLDLAHQFYGHLNDLYGHTSEATEGRNGLIRTNAGAPPPQVWQVNGTASSGPALNGKALQLNLGYSHDVTYDIPPGIEIKVPKPTEIVISGIDKQRVGQVAAEIREYRGPEPYKGKGVKYAGEYIFRKEGKKK